MQSHVPGAQGSVHARYLHLGFIAQKRVAAPLFVGLGGFQQVAVCRNVFEYLHCLDGRADVRQYLAADGRDLVLAPGREDLDFFDRR